MLNRLKHLFGDKKNKEFGINNITPIEKIAPKEQIDLIRFFLKMNYQIVKVATTKIFYSSIMNR